MSCEFLGGSQLALVGFSLILYVMYTWWRDIVREATFEEQHTVPVQRGLRLGMILFIKRIGVFFGQCSEICGVNHGFMPIVIVSLPTLQFHNYIMAKLELS